MMPNRFPLQQYNSFYIDCFTEYFQEINTLHDLVAGDAQLQSHAILLGCGSNILFVDKTTPPIINMRLKGIDVAEYADSYKVTVAAGELWHELVKFTINNNIPGLENLALIPGTVGAAPIQNIGAYGVEFSSVCESVQWYDFSTKQFLLFDNNSCQFNYRDSIFKNELKHTGVVTRVTLSLTKHWRPKLDYHGLDGMPEHVTCEQIYQKVIQLRQSKLPDPAKLPNAGSFFKNPIIDQQQLDCLKQDYPTIVYYPMSAQTVKVAAGWLIEQAGLKGYRYQNVGVHEKQALVLVNYNQGTGQEILDLALFIQKKVYDKFGVLLEPEVRLIDKTGDISLNDMDID